MVASTRQRDALSPAGVTIATLVYVSFAVILVVRWPPWLLAVTTAGAVASMAAGTPDLLVGPDGRPLAIENSAFVDRVTRSTGRNQRSWRHAEMSL